MRRGCSVANALALGMETTMDLYDNLTNSGSPQSDLWSNLYIDRLHRLVGLHATLYPRPGGDDPAVRLISRAIGSTGLDYQEMGLATPARTLLSGSRHMQESRSHDVVIVGGSFAGLATAMQLVDHRVLVIDQYPIGSRQMSACGVPLPTVQAVGAERSILETHDELVMHTGGREVGFALRIPYVTVDYRAFCESMLSQTSADLWQTRATGQEGGGVTTNRGSARATFVVDAGGWRSGLGRGLRPGPAPRHAGYGIETELPVRITAHPGLHFFFERDIVRDGYAWIFPCGETTRFGVCSFESGAGLRQRLQAFVHRYGYTVGATHGGAMAIERGDPVAGGVFLVGDAAGQCLPTTAEGIRPAIYHGIHCGRAISGVLDGQYAAEEAAERYRQAVQWTEPFHRHLLALQHVAAWAPEWALAAVGRLCAPPAIIERVLRRYLGRSGFVPLDGLAHPHLVRSRSVGGPDHCREHHLGDV